MSPEILERVSRLRSAGRGVVSRRVLLVAAVTVLVVGVVWSWRSAELVLADLQPVPLVVLVVVLSPLAVAANAVEYRAVAAGLGAPVDRRSALRVTVMATAANLLPLPGAALTRLADLRSRGATTGRSSAALAGTAGLWIGVSVAGATVALLRGQPAAAAVAAALAAAATIVGLAVLHRAHVSPRHIGAIALAQVAIVVIGALRIAAAMAVLGRALGVVDALVLGSAGVLASATGVVPGGIGLAEGIAALIAPLVDAAPPLAFAAVALNRASGLAVAAVAGLAVRNRPTDPSPPTGERSTT